MQSHFCRWPFDRGRLLGCSPHPESNSTRQLSAAQASQGRADTAGAKAAAAGMQHAVRAAASRRTGGAGWERNWCRPRPAAACRQCSCPERSAPGAGCRVEGQRRRGRGRHGRQVKDDRLASLGGAGLGARPVLHTACTARLVWQKGKAEVGLPHMQSPASTAGLPFAEASWLASATASSGSEQPAGAPRACCAAAMAAAGTHASLASS